MRRAGGWAAVLLATSVSPVWAQAGGSVTVTVPELSPVARAGKEVFDKHCGSCHGPNAGGTAQGPPLVHKIYEPSHHGDAAFLLAVRQGVPRHHWRFGPMPPLPQVKDEDVAKIVRYVRELQRANGIK